jgi:alpha-galactosidase
MAGLARKTLLIAAWAAAAVNAYSNGLALTPQMGWNTWNHFGCDISEDTILSAAQAFVKYNLTQFGYECEFMWW